MNSILVSDAGLGGSVFFSKAWSFVRVKNPILYCSRYDIRPYGAYNVGLHADVLRQLCGRGILNNMFVFKNAAMQDVHFSGLLI